VEKEADPFPLLKISYDLLPTENLRKCFLRCAMWPEDASPCEDLVRCWLGMELIEEYDDIVQLIAEGIPSSSGLNMQGY